MTARSRVISIRFPADEYEVLRWYARMTGRSFNGEVIRATRRHLAVQLRPERIERLVTDGRSTVEKILARVGEQWQADGDR